MFQDILTPRGSLVANKVTQHDLTFQREKMVESLQKLGVTNKRVLEAMKKVPRHEFVPQIYREAAYDNSALPIGFDQTISQPLCVAKMLQSAEIEETDRVLEIGAGCGYNAALLSHLASEVYSTEIIPDLLSFAQKNITKLGEFKNVTIVSADSEIGLPEYVPYDVIIVTAAASSVPQTLKDQLAVGGRMIIPILRKGNGGGFGGGGETLIGKGYDDLTKVKRVAVDRYEEKHLGEVRFVPLCEKKSQQQAVKEAVE